jgi:hypothetical protein
MCKLNSPGANFKASTRRKNTHAQTNKKKINNNNNNKSIPVTGRGDP